MAEYKRSDAVADSKDPLPTDRYSAQVKGTKYGKSAKGFDMVTLACEIYAPETVDGATGPVFAAGKKFNLFLMFVPDESWGLERVFEFADKVGISLPEAIDPERDHALFKNVAFDAIVGSGEEAFKKYQAGPKKGEFILDGEGKKISNGFYLQANLQDVIGPASVAAPVY